MRKKAPGFISIDMRESLSYYLCGQLNAHGFVHAKRNLTIPVLIIVNSGTLCIKIEDKEYRVGKDEMILLPDGFEHCGFKDEDESGKLVYFWVHFSVNNDYAFDRACGADTRIPIYMKLINPARANILCRQLMDVSKTAPVDYKYCSFLLDALVCELSFQAKNTHISSNRAVNVASAWIKLHTTEPISLEDVANEIGYNKRYLARVFKENMGISVNRYIEESKIEIAKNMLIYSDESVKNIAEYLGYEDAGYFMRVFKKNENMTCLKFRNVYSKMNINKM